MELLLIWLASIALAVAWASTSHKSKWWVGLIGGIALGPLGVALVWLDVATYRPGVTT